MLPKLCFNGPDFRKEKWLEIKGYTYRCIFIFSFVKIASGIAETQKEYTATFWHSFSWNLEYNFVYILDVIVYILDVIIYILDVIQSNNDNYYKYIIIIIALKIPRKYYVQLNSITVTSKINLKAKDAVNLLYYNFVSLCSPWSAKHKSQ